MAKHPPNEAPKPAPPRRSAGALPGGAQRSLLFPLFVLLLAALSSATLLAGCAGLPGAGKRAGEGAHEKPSPAEAVRLSYRTTAETKTARVAMTTTVIGAPAPGGGAAPGTRRAPASLTLTADGVVDYANGNAMMTMRLPGAEPLETRILGEVAYQKVPEEARGQRPGSKPWAKVDMRRLYREQYGASPAEMRGGTPSDPADQLRYLRGVSEGVKETGKEEVRGVPTTRYEATIDLKKAAEQAREKGAAREAAERTAARLGTGKIPVGVWLDAEGRVRRSAMAMPLPNEPRGGPAVKGSVRVVQELYDFGVPVRVEAPPAGQTEDVTDEVLKQSSSTGKAA